MPRKKPSKRRVKPRTVKQGNLATIISALDDGVVFSTVAVSYTFTFRTRRIQASVVVLPDIPCGECDRDGVLFVVGHCVRCREEFAVGLCLHSFATLTKAGVLALHERALLCAKCADGATPDAQQLPLNLGPVPDRMKARWN